MRKRKKLTLNIKKIKEWIAIMIMMDKHIAEKDRNESTAIRGTVAGQNMWTYC